MDSIRTPRRLGHLNWENFHALLIGIDKYSARISSLNGAVRDMVYMKDFLLSSFDVPEGSQLDIRELTNEAATHSKIIDAIRKLEIDPLVKKNDAILIYYSGHGASIPPPEGWPGYSRKEPEGGWPEKTKIQCIVAADAQVSKENHRHFASGVVLDRTLAALLHNLADKKGSNITIILDCCHSGSGTRDASELFRGIEFSSPEGKPITVPGDYQMSIWEKFIDFNRGAVIDYKYRHAGLESHVLLAACGSEERASDGYSFTQGLLNYLKKDTINLSALSYVGLIRGVVLKSKRDRQHPLCEGNSKHSMLFDLKEINVGRPTFDVIKDNGKLILCAGGMVGVHTGTEYGVYTSKVFSINSTLIGNFVVGAVGATTSSLICSEEELKLIEYESAVASPRVASPSKFFVHVGDDSIVSCVKDAIQRENPEDQFGRPQLCFDVTSPVDNLDWDLTLDIRDGEIAFLYPKKSKVGKFGLDGLQFTLSLDSPRVRRVLRSAAHFFDHLNRESQSGNLKDGVEVFLCELEDSSSYEIVNGKIRREMKFKRRLPTAAHGAYEVEAAMAGSQSNSIPAYGIEIVNKTKFPLFAWVFFFDCSTLEIGSFYDPPVSKGSAVVDPTLPACVEGTGPTPVALNFRNGGGKLLRLQLYEGQSLDIGFLKIFISKKYLGGGLSSIVQPPPLVRDTNGVWRGIARQSRPYDGRPLKRALNGSDDTWDVLTVPLTLIRDEEDALEAVRCATSMLEECLGGLSFSKLDAAVLLFRQVSNRYTAPHPLYAEATFNLISSLSVRFMYTYQIGDFLEASRLPLKTAEIYEFDTTDNTPLDESNAEMRLGKAHLVDFHRSIPLHVLNTVIDMVQQSLLYLSSNVDTKVVALTTLAKAVFTRFLICSDTAEDDFNLAISSLQDALTYIPQGDDRLSMLRFCIHGMLASRLDTSGDISYVQRTSSIWMDEWPLEVVVDVLERFQSARELYKKFMKSGDLQALNNAEKICREGVQTLPRWCGDRLLVIDLLAAVLLDRFRVKGEEGDLEQAISLFRQIIELQHPPHFDLPLHLSNLAQALSTKFKQEGELDDLDEAIALSRRSLDLAPLSHPNRHGFMENLGVVLSARFRHEGQPDDLDESISLLRQSMKIQQSLGSEQSSTLTNFANSLLTRFNQKGDLQDLNDSISMHRQALKLHNPSDPEKASCLINLANSLLTRFEQAGQLDDLDESVSLNREALEILRPPHPSRSKVLMNLGQVLSTRFRHRGLQDDLVESMSLLEQALVLQSPPHPLRPISLSSLANSLIYQYHSQGNQLDLDKAISLQQQALELRRSPHPDRSGSLTNLANALFTRFEQGNQISDLDEAIKLDREALSLILPSLSTRINPLINLGRALSTRFRHTGHQGDLDESISLLQEALKLQKSSHPHRCTCLTNLANSFLTRFAIGGKQHDLDESVTLFEQVLELRPLNHPDRPGSLANLAISLFTRFQKRGQQFDLDEAIRLNKEALELNLSSHLSRSRILINYGQALWIRFSHKGERSDLDESISILGKALELQSPSDPYRSMSLGCLAGSLLTRFKQDGQKNDLDGAISLYRQSLPLRPPPHPDRASSLTNLADALLCRFSQASKNADLDEAISLNREALELFPETHPNRSVVMINLGTCLCTRFHHRGQRNDLNESISILESVREPQLSSHLHRPILLRALVVSLMVRFEQDSQQSDLDRVISYHKQVLALEPPPHPDRLGSLINLAGALFTRFEQKNDISDLDEAISLHQEALDPFLPSQSINNPSSALEQASKSNLFSASHPLLSTLLNQFASSLLARFRREGEQRDLDYAISVGRRALELRQAPHSDRPGSLINLASALLTRFQQQGRQDDLDESISLSVMALEILPSSHLGKVGALKQLGYGLSMRFDYRGQRRDLDESVSLFRQAVELVPLSHAQRAETLSRLANSLLDRFLRSREQQDLEESISLHRQALERQSPSHSARPSFLTNLASALGTRYEQTHEPGNLDEAISLNREALLLFSPSHPYRFIVLTNLGNLLSTRFLARGQRDDLDESITLLRQALEYQPLSHPLRPITLNNLARALATQCKETGKYEDHDESIHLHREALGLRPSPHPDRSASLHNLAYELSIRYQNRGQGKDLEEAMSLFLDATQYLYQSSSYRLRVAKRWIAEAKRNQHGSAITAYQAALRALPQVAALSLSVESRHKALAAGSDGLARDASSCAIDAGNFELAIELLEGGRSVFWSQVLSLRSPVDRLLSIEPNGPELANKLRNVAAALEAGSHRIASTELFDNERKISIEQETSRMTALSEEWEETVIAVRKIEGFEDFLTPPRFSSLKHAAVQHPIILLVSNDDKSHCLIMTASNIHHIPLPNLRTPVLKVLVDNVRTAVSQTTIPRSLIDETQETIARLLGEERGISYQNDSEDSDEAFRFVLGMLWDELVKPVIDYLNIKTSTPKPILQWCPTGYFTFLPLHAAGRYGGYPATECALDYFISTYTPTIGALLSRPYAPAPDNFRMMTVIQSHELPSTEIELMNIRQHVSPNFLIELGVAGSPAGVEDVASRLADISVVHFACHGMQDPFKPLDSGLKLDDGILRISRIMKENMRNGSLAFLCACETAMGDEKLPDEAMNIGASLLFSGFERVVATMWAMRDDDGPTIANVFYRELLGTNDGQRATVPDVTKSAYALHTAVQELRSNKVSFRRWVPFIYMGK
ncbi:hypothetical protein JR316_0002689 [Psilocybe cubensis]|uniref:Uncharacterized protein n=2 Tax=Psilocybe cubensis TaxID=181762 RepID=A0ACB8HDK8_PSICU|nr:hypothetical protein JR316_0002689 [Psilocybe cubensis]KAH9485774.1 hypothetical protein JR316_0002689 [Psilocybe cubensis]